MPIDSTALLRELLEKACQEFTESGKVDTKVLMFFVRHGQAHISIIPLLYYSEGEKVAVMQEVNSIVQTLNPDLVAMVTEGWMHMEKAASEAELKEKLLKFEQEIGAPRKSPTRREAVVVFLQTPEGLSQMAAARIERDAEGSRTVAMDMDDRPGRSEVRIIPPWRPESLQ